MMKVDTGFQKPRGVLKVDQKCCLHLLLLHLLRLVRCLSFEFAPMPQQRRNLRYPAQDGLTPPIRVAPNVGIVISHAELPPRQRKRLQVGATNLWKSSPTPDFDAPEDGTRRICATNVDLIKATTTTASAGSDFRIGHRDEREPNVIRTEFRRLRSLTPSSSTSRLQVARNSRTADGDRDATTRMTAVTHQDPSHHQDILVTDLAIVEQDANARRQEQRSTKLKQQHAQFVKHRKLLYEAFVQKYGSMRAVFKAFDSDGDGVISFQRFLNMVEASEVGLTPDETRAMYANVDTNGDNAVEFHEFAQMFTASELGSSDLGGNGSPRKLSGADDSITSDPGSSYALKYRSPLELSPRSRERMKELRGKVTAQLATLHGLDVSIHGGKNEELLMYAFKQFDSDNDGVLSYEQAKSALGKDFLKLPMQSNEMEEMIRMIDRNGDELISMKEFVQYFGVGKREIPTDLLDNGRKKALTALHHKMNAKLTPREEFDPEYFEKRARGVEDKEKVLDTNVVDSPGCLPESLSKRIAAALVFQTSPSPSRVVLGDSKSAPALGLKREGERTPSRGSPDLNAIIRVNQDRFQHRRMERTDWTRVGLGGDGVAQASGLYMGESERFRTTTADAYSPLRRGLNSGDLSRDQPPKSTLEFDARERVRHARFERTQAQLQQHEATRAKEERLHDWKQRATMRRAAGQQFAYLDRIHEQEQRVAMKDLQTQKRHGGVRFLRMWAGSPDSPFDA